MSHFFTFLNQIKIDSSPLPPLHKDGKKTHLRHDGALPPLSHGGLKQCTSFRFWEPFDPPAHQSSCWCVHCPNGSVSSRQVARCPPAQLDQGPASQDAPSSHSSLRFCSGKEQVPLKGPQHFEPFINLRMHSLTQGLPLWPCLSSLLPLPHRFLFLQERPS